MGYTGRLTWFRLTILILITLLAANVYRALKQSVAIDEAFTYDGTGLMSSRTSANRPAT